jgi:L-ascorbate metabolism protein UlaG (beta-lactamase superfamily)
MNIRWYGQSAFTLTGAEHTVTIDPFGVPRAGLPVHFGYPEISPHPADVLLITHEHFDHNGAEVVTGAPEVIRSTAGVFSTELGEVTAIASEHDPAAGTQRGPNTIFVFELDGRRVCHFGDFGQPAMRAEQRHAIGDVDLLMIPVGGGPTLDAEQAVRVVSELRPRWIVPMHYRTDAIDFLEPADAFIGRFDRVVHTPDPEHELDAWDGTGPSVLHLAAPVG